ESTYRNRRGERIGLSSVTASELKTESASVLERALADGAVVITKHGEAKAVLLSYQEFEALTNARAATLDTLTREFNERLLTDLQKPAAIKALAESFNAAPSRLGA